MATLISTKEDVRQYVSTAFNFTFTSIEPYVKRAEREYIKAIIGDTLYDSWTTTPPVSATIQEVYELFKEASANLAVFLYIPVGSVNIGDDGILVVESQTSKKAEWWQVRDLQRSLSDLGLSTIDEALKIMEANEELFAGWNTTEGYTIFKELLVPKTQDFQRHFNISSSRRTFLALRPFQLESQNKIFNWLDATTLSQLFTADNTVKQTAQDYARAAQINHTVAIAAQSGIFQFTPTGLFLRSLELPGEKTKPVEESVIAQFVNSRLQAAEEWLKKLKTYISENTDVFTSYQESTTEASVFVHNTNSIVAF